MEMTPAADKPRKKSRRVDFMIVLLMQAERLHSFPYCSAGGTPAPQMRYIN
jgi:hypothetical protein